MFNRTVLLRSLLFALALLLTVPLIVPFFFHLAGVGYHGTVTVHAECSLPPCDTFFNTVDCQSPEPVTCFPADPLNFPNGGCEGGCEGFNCAGGGQMSYCNRSHIPPSLWNALNCTKGSTQCGTKVVGLAYSCALWVYHDLETGEQVYYCTCELLHLTQEPCMVPSVDDFEECDGGDIIG